MSENTLKKYAIEDPEIVRKLTNFFYFVRNKRVLIIGAGGGGDVCGCLPVYRWLQSCDAEPILGSLTWERTVVFNDYGPRSFDQIEGLEKIYGTVAIGSEKTVIAKDKTPFQATSISRTLNQPIIYLDISKGVQPLVKDLTNVISKEHIEFILILDVGGDILAQGSEPGLRSPLADAMTLATVAQIKIPQAIGIFGLNSDGELTLDELDRYIYEFNKKDFVFGQRFHSDEELEFLEKVLDKSGAITEASRQPLKVWHGQIGEGSIRNGQRMVKLHPILTRTFFLRAENIFENSPIAQTIKDTTSIIEANNLLLNNLQIVSEYEMEKRNLENENI